MAIKPVIYKFIISLSDLELNYYDTLKLTVAQHPSETPERMMARVLALCLNASALPRFTKGLSEPDEPDIIAHSLDGQMTLWIDVGEPALERIKKATRIASNVKVYSFNSKSSVWWQQNKNSFQALQVAVYRLDWDAIKTLAAGVQRTMEMSLTISGDSLYVASEHDNCEIKCNPLQINLN